MTKTKSRSKPHTLDEIEELLRDAKTPAAVFGDDVEAELRRLELICHPDRHPGDVARATQIFQRLQSLAKKPPATKQLVKSPKRTYELGELLAVGDVADVYAATSEATDATYVVKVSRVPGTAAMLENEKTALHKIHAAAGDTVYRLNFPLLLESFLAGSRRVNVFADISSENSVYSLEQLLTKYPGGLPGEHLVWIGKKLLTALGFAHLQKLVHGAVVPSHVLIQPETHMVILAGWGQSVERGQKIKSAVAKYGSFYPAEVLAKKPATAETDIFMAARCLEHLSGSFAIPPALRNSLRACLLERQSMRPGDAWVVNDDLAAAAERVYGPPKFVPLFV
jgi:serine/threonine protein kinase